MTPRTRPARPCSARLTATLLTLSWAALALGGCFSPLDTLGVETLVSEHEQLSKSAQLEDDQIGDKHPLYDPNLTVVESFGGCPLTLNKSASVTRLDVVPFAKDEAALDGALFADRGAALTALAAAPGLSRVPSMEVVNGAAKHANDAVYAAVERVAQDGLADAFVGKRALLGDLATALFAALDAATASQRPHVEAALVHIACALSLSGTPLTETLPAALIPAAQAALDRFEADPVNARPMGFYAGDAALEAIFRQDRFLQNHGGAALGDQFGMFVALSAVIEADPALIAAYERVLAIYEGLTNPYVAYPPTALFAAVDGLAALDDLAGVQVAFLAQHPERFPCPGAYPYLAVLPASASKDTRFYNANYCLTGPPANASFIDVLIAAIRAGSLDLAPDPDSGWYDYQLHALETLLLPERGLERDHLLLTAAYKKKLIDTFKSIITQTRETHAKQLLKGEMGTAEPLQAVDVYPQLAVEPFPTYYLRTARGYRFVATWLTGVLGDAGMARPVAAGGATVAATLEALTARFYGLYAVAADSVGLDPAAGLLAEELAPSELAAARTAARAWLADWERDPAVAADSRVIVPVALDGARGEVIYWAVIGVKALKINAAFVKGFEPTLVAGGECSVKGFVGHDYALLVEDMVEVRLRADAAPPTRAELRALCDAHGGDREAIVAALEAL